MKSLLRRSPMYHLHRMSGATVSDYSGWSLPSSYTTLEEDFERLMKVGGICDISHYGKLNVQGNDVFNVLTSRLNLDSDLCVGSSHSSNLLVNGNPTGENVVATGLAYDEALVLTRPGKVSLVVKALESSSANCVHLVDYTSSLAGVIIAGCRSRSMLSRIVEYDLDDSVFPNGASVQCRAAEVHVIIIRSDLGELPAFQIYITRDFGEYFWNALLHAGVSDGISPVGLESVMRLG